MEINPGDIPAFHGVIENWSCSGGMVFGHVYHDRKGRFTNGAAIRTSRIDRVQGVLVYTRNSVYVLGQPATP